MVGCKNHKGTQAESSRCCVKASLQGHRKPAEKQFSLCPLASFKKSLVKCCREIEALHEIGRKSAMRNSVYNDNMNVIC